MSEESRNFRSDKPKSEFHNFYDKCCILMVHYQFISVHLSAFHIHILY